MSMAEVSASLRVALRRSRSARRCRAGVEGYGVSTGGGEMLVLWQISCRNAVMSGSTGDRMEGRLRIEMGSAISGDVEREAVVDTVGVASGVDRGETGVNGLVRENLRRSTISSWVLSVSWLQVSGGERWTSCSTNAQASGIHGIVGSGGFGLAAAWILA